jgi:hypothetical protein
VLGGRYRKAADRLGVVAGSERGRAAGKTIAALAEADALPGPGDTLALIPPTGRAFVRRVHGRNLWIWAYGAGAANTVCSTARLARGVRPHHPTNA